MQLWVQSIWTRSVLMDLPNLYLNNGTAFTQRVISLPIYGSGGPCHESFVVDFFLIVSILAFMRYFVRVVLVYHFQLWRAPILGTISSFWRMDSLISIELWRSVWMRDDTCRNNELLDIDLRKRKGLARRLRRGEVFFAPRSMRCQLIRAVRYLGNALRWCNVSRAIAIRHMLNRCVCAER